MPGGPIFPRSVVFPNDGKAFPNVHIGSVNVKREEGVGVIAALDADAVVEVRFQLPPAIPSGTPSLRVRALANAVSGDTKFNPKWKSVAVGENSDVATGSLNAEGTQTLSWTAGDVDDYLQIQVTLDADVLVLDEEVVMEIAFETAGWTLAAVSTWIFSIVWE